MKRWKFKEVTALYKKFLKRVIDFVLAVSALPVWGIIFMVIGPLIYFEDKGPVFYNSPRLGRGGKIFKMYKFRSMKKDAPDIRNRDGSTFNSEDDPRLTRIGKFIRNTSLDETPQLLNILKGDMSIVGPRPDLPEHEELYSVDEKRKLEVRPGVTGFNQAYYRNMVPWKERIKHDIYYVDHISLKFDLKIILKTVECVWKHRAVYITNDTKEAE